MSLINNWKDYAVCSSDKDQEAWMSYNKDKIAYAKLGCERCNVRRECFLNAWEQDEFYGVCGGVSEYEVLLATWKEAKKKSDVNWKRTDRILQKFMRQIA